MVLKLGLKPQATLFGGECSRLHMFPPPPTPLPLMPPLLNPTLMLITSHFLQNFGLREGWNY